MNWLSIKKYTPPACQYVFIRAVNSEYDRYFVAMIEDFANIKNLSDWELANGDNTFVAVEGYEVTHFAIIDPVVVE